MPWEDPAKELRRRAYNHEKERPALPWPFFIGALGLLMMGLSGAMILAAPKYPWFFLGIGYFGIFFICGFVLLVIAYALRQ